MPEFFTFLFKVNLSLILFCLAYYVILRRLTFYTLNRFFLIAGIFFSSLYPLFDLSGFFKSSSHLVVPLSGRVIYRVMSEVSVVDYWLLAKVVFWLGVFYMALRMIIRLYSLYKIHKSSVPGEIGAYSVRLLKGESSTFSFWKSIYLNPGQHHPEELNAILEHEQVHVRELHTLDILLAELATVFYWFNPGVWFMRKAVKENVEFITDQKILRKGIDRKAYQYSMLYTGSGIKPSVLMNNFNITGIRRRIVMMNSKQSSSFQLIRYALLLPFIFLITTAFTLIRTEIKSNQTEKKIHQMVSQIFPEKAAEPVVASIAPKAKKKKMQAVKLLPLPQPEPVQEETKEPVRIIKMEMTYTGNKPADTAEIHTRMVGIAKRIGEVIDQPGINGVQGKSPKTITVRLDKTNGTFTPSSGDDVVIRAIGVARPKEAMGSGTITELKAEQDGKEISPAQLKDLKAGEIKSIRVIRNKDDAHKGTIFVYTSSYTQTPKN
ncbi:M56 family metallopeptidase [Pedobacter nutrimenti]|uniref:BlaR1 peptidase M56 n=1 Tax=Pedobacter nutrimenti TaxID=1241337 RepID=A0A318UHF6_9SPHI|nr:M56 family metallopeptidase [Pedobacter nutrimenti]PYF74458.1 BlaR1 peptidase M56 [Pedobacter nutrimenti]